MSTPARTEADIVREAYWDDVTMTDAEYGRLVEEADDADRAREVAAEAPPRDEHGNEATGVCMNCGEAMVENPSSPWCPDCEEVEET